MKVGLVGFTGSGKSTVFRWLTGETPDPSRIQQGQVGQAEVPDERLDKMSAVYKPKKTKHATIDFYDTPGLLVDERKDNPRRLGVLREANGLVVVLDGFSGADLGGQLRRFRSELLFADLELVTNRLERLEVSLKKSRPAKEREQDLAEQALLKRVAEVLEDERSASELGLKPEEEKLIRSFQLFTLKPEMVLINQGDANPSEPLPEGMPPGTLAAPVRLELELEELDEESRAEFMKDLGVAEMSRPAVLQKIFYGVGRVVFFTVGHDECRAWPIPEGASAVEAAGEIHTDLSNRFVRAEVIGYDDFVNVGYSEKEAKARGVMRLEGKTYTVKDGDVMHILASS